MATRAHGALVRVETSGVLLLGPSGIGKSECALELVRRGHALVADDVVEMTRGEDGRLVGCAPALIRYHLELRGIGVVSVPELFGDDAVLDECGVDLVCHLEAWEPGFEVERLGIERPRVDYDGVSIPAFRLPARPAASLATLVEVAVRETAQRENRPSAAERLDRRLRDRRPARPGHSGHEEGA